MIAGDLFYDVEKFVKNAIEKRDDSRVDVEECKCRKNQGLCHASWCKTNFQLFGRATVESEGGVHCLRGRRKGCPGQLELTIFGGFIRGVVVVVVVAGWVGNTTNSYTTIKRVFVMVSRNRKIVLRGWKMREVEKRAKSTDTWALPLHALASLLSFP
jgi:hypothetical protein